MNSVQVSSSSFCMYIDDYYTNALRTNLVRSKSKNKNGLETITKFLIYDKTGVTSGVFT